MVNKEYDYIRGNTALNPKRKYDEIDRRIQKEKQERERRERLRREKNAKKQVVKNILHVALVALIFGVLTIARNGKVYGLQKDLSKVRSEINLAIEEGNALKAELYNYEAIDKVRTIASESGMKMPTKDDTITVDITTDYFANIRE
ncbi:cell division protein FtsL [Clostridium tertium]|uniref:Cell division protein FtsL n=1 Tax=Clostridium tertium TaxID=1559 RepID=A0A6N3GHX3_9CLOT